MEIRDGLYPCITEWRGLTGCRIAVHIVLCMVEGAAINGSSAASWFNWGPMKKSRGDHGAYFHASGSRISEARNVSTEMSLEAISGSRSSTGGKTIHHRRYPLS